MNDNEKFVSVVVKNLFCHDGRKATIIEQCRHLMANWMVKIHVVDEAKKSI